MIRSIGVYAVVWAASALLPSFSHAAGDPEKGRDISQEHCSRCHVVGDFNRMGGIGSTPSFQVLRGMPDWQERFETFFARRPHQVHVRIEGLPRLNDLPPNAAPFTLTLEDVDHILSFVEDMPTR